MSLVPTRALFDLAGRTAMVTGAARGIGQAVARRLADAGASIVACDRSVALCDETVRLVRESGGQIVAVGGDLSVANDIDRMVAEAAAAFGGIDILVNNAALRGFSTWDSLSEADWDRFMAVNAKAVFFTSQAAGKHMVARGNGGAIVNVASVAAVRPVPQKVDYNAAKAAVVMLTKSLALELGKHRIRVNAVGPGATDTQGGGTDGQTNDDARRFAEAWIARLVLPVEFAEPDDIARVVLFLASPASGYVTGQVIYADAGFLIG